MDPSPHNLILVLVARVLILSWTCDETVQMTPSSVYSRRLNPRTLRLGRNRASTPVRNRSMSSVSNQRARARKSRRFISSMATIQLLDEIARTAISALYSFVGRHCGCIFTNVRRCSNTA